MPNKVLIADDSLTIQKVIRITLSGESFDILDCDSQETLYQLVEEENPSIVFLDFSLDETLSGYEICQKIKKISPRTKVMMMYGTFDSIDDELFTRSHADAKITKPFDGQKFITLCHQLMNDTSFIALEGDESSLEKIEEHLDEVNKEFDASEANHELEEVIEIADDDIDDSIDWQMDDSQNHISESQMNSLHIDDEDDFDSQVNFDNSSEIKLVEDEVEVEIPEESSYKKEGDDIFDYHKLLSEAEEEWEMSVPAKLEEDNLLVESEFEPEEEIEEIIEDHNFEEVSMIEREVFNNDDDSEEDAYFPNEEGDLEAHNLIGFSNDNSFEKVETHLESSLGDDDVWNPDEDTTDEILEEEEKIQNEEISEVSKKDIQFLVEKYVREYMDTHGKGIIEKISWEMIPDLAENIIREEVSQIAQKVLKDNS